MPKKPIIPPIDPKYTMEDVLTKMLDCEPPPKTKPKHVTKKKKVKKNNYL